MATDYRKFKTPFYDISISDSKGKGLVKLPHHILRLISKVEIQETFKPKANNVITIEFVEGSREPASTDKELGTDGLYKIPFSSETSQADKSISGSITNRPGSILDLRFSGSGGITFLTEQEQEEGELDNSPQENVDGKIVTRKHIQEQKAPKLLFQERNQVKVTWGYREDPDTIRSVRGYIMMVQADYPENGQVKTTIVCHDTGAALDQVGTRKPVPFATRKRVGENNSYVEFEDPVTDQMVKDIANKAGMKAIVSKNLLRPTEGKNHQKIWISEQSFNEFMEELAKRHDCIYKVIPDPETGLDTLVFMKRTDFESKLVISDRDLLTYKGPGSILKNVSLKASFKGVVGNTQVGVNQEGDNEGSSKNHAVEVRQFKASNGNDEQKVPSDPAVGANTVLAAEGVAKNITTTPITGTLKNNPSVSAGFKDDEAEVESIESERVITIEFTTMGYTQLLPGVVELRNLGVRYSGKYRLYTVTHIIDGSGGYITQCMGKSQAVSAGGVITPASPKGEEPEEKVDEQLLSAEEEDDVVGRDSVRTEDTKEGTEQRELLDKLLKGTGL